MQTNRLIGELYCFGLGHLLSTTKRLSSLLAKNNERKNNDLPHHNHSFDSSPMERSLINQWAGVWYIYTELGKIYFQGECRMLYESNSLSSCCLALSIFILLLHHVEPKRHSLIVLLEWTNFTLKNACASCWFAGGFVSYYFNHFVGVVPSHASDTTCIPGYVVDAVNRHPSFVVFHTDNRTKRDPCWCWHHP